MKMNVKLDQKEVENIVREHLAKKFKSVGEVHTDIGYQSVGYGQSERNEVCFNGMTCEVEMES